MTETPVPSDAPLKLLVEAEALRVAGDLAAAEQLLRSGLQAHPGEPRLIFNLALILHSLKRSQEAEELLRTLTVGPPETPLLMGDIQEALGRQNDAFRSYKEALKLMPRSYQVLMKLGALKEKMGDKPGARDCYRDAMDLRPLDWAATTSYILAIWDKDPGLAVKAAEELLDGAQTPDERFRALEFNICRKEWWERIRRGQMPYHAERVDELFFTYASDYVKEFHELAQQRVNDDPTNIHWLRKLASARFCAKDRIGAGEIWETLAKYSKESILENVRLAPKFYDELRKFTDADLTRGLPPMIEVAPPVPDPNGVLYLSCNFTYFQAFALPMIVSARERSPQTAVHVHIMDADEAQTSAAAAFLQRLAPLRFALTIERPGLQKAPQHQARSYYHAVRFIRYYQHLLDYNCPLWLMDVDAVINTDLSDLFSKLKGVDLSMRIRPGRMEPWNQFNACVVGASTSPASIEYIRLTAAYLAHFFQNGNLRWGIDQLAMYGVYADMNDRGTAPTLALLGEREVDYDYRDDGFVWCNSGAGKFKHLQRISKPNSMPLANFEDNKFVGVFERYWNDCVRIMNESLPS